jgi:sugar-specific transcriptional regulator TrmB
MYFYSPFIFLVHNCTNKILQTKRYYELVCSAATIKYEKLKLTNCLFLTEGGGLEPEFSQPQILLDLGLTLKQARVYMALVESGSSRISTISKVSKVARPDLYQTLSKLQQLGLVERIIETPLEYRATPINEGISLLLQTKTRQYEKVRAEAKILLSTVKIEKPTKKEIETPQFVLIPKRTVIERIKDAIEKAQLSVDVVLSWKRFSQGIVGMFAESMEIALGKNVRVRFVIESPPEGKTSEQLVQLCGKKPFCKVRFMPHYPEAVFGIYDGKEIFMVIKSKTDLPSSPALWSNNPSLISLAKGYFKILWLASIEELTFPFSESHAL